MPGPLHGRQTALDGNHTLIAYKFADATDRIAFTNEVSGNAANAGPPVADDVGKLAHQLDNDTFWLLTVHSPVTWIPASAAGTVPDSRTITAGAGLTGGGDLTADRTIDVVANGDGSITVNTNDIQVGVLATNAQHGNRGGGSLHANAVAGAPGTAGFITGVDQQKLDNSGVLTSTAPADVTKAAAVVGVSTETARADHKHDVTTATPPTVGTANAEGTATSLSRSDHVHDHGAQTSGTLHAAAIAGAPGTAGFITGVDQDKLDNIEALADVTDFANVRTSLGGDAGANVGWVFKSDGAGSGAMAVNKTTIVRKFTVGLAGSDVDYNSIATAVGAAITAGVSLSNSYLIEVYPGTYTEPPFTLPTGLILATADGERGRFTVIIASNALADLVTCTGGAIYGFELRGVTDPAAALIRYAAASTATSFGNLTFNACSNGLIVENGATLALDNVLVGITAAASAVTNAFIFRGTNTVIVARRLMGNVPAAVLPAYPGINPIETFIKADTSARVELSQISTNIAHNTGTQTSILADGGCELLMQASLLTGSATGVRIGSVGTTQLKLSAVDFSLNTLNIESLSSSATIQANITVDELKATLASGTVFSGLVLNRTNATSNTYGLSTTYATPAGFETLQVADHLYQTGSSAAYTGGELTDGGGLNIDIAAGSGTVRDTTDDFIRSVTWTSASILLSASTTYFISYQASTDTIVATIGTPGSADLLLGIVSTTGAAIRYIHNTAHFAADLPFTLHDYLYTTRRVLLKTGLTPQIGSGATKITVDAGSYYIALHSTAYAGAVDATFSAFYGADGATELTAQTDVNTTQWDNAGTLTAFTAGYYRSDTLYLTSDGRLSLIFGIAEYAAQVDAETAAVAAPMTFISASAIILGSFIVQQGVGSVAVIDRRPTGAATGGAAGAAITNHGLLSGLGDDDHMQYLLTSGTRAMSGSLDMGANAITNVGNVDGVDISAHASRHAPGALDALSTGTAAAALVGDVNAEGVAATFARSDHKHAVSRATPSTVGATNVAGTASTFVGSDHVHAHGAQTDGTMHAAAIAGAPGTAGFITGVNQQKLNDSGILTSTAPADVTKAAAAVGVSVETARADHKHDITTAAAGTIAVGDAAAEGAATSLARSDHTHALTAPAAPVNVTKAAAAAGVATTVARSDHKHDVTTAAANTITVGAAAAEGAATSLARSDHTHALTAPAAPVNVTKAAASAGVATTVARSDHKHDITTGVPVATGGANAEGTATTLARSDHVHATGAASGGSIQTVFNQITVDTSTTSTTFVTLMSQAITVAANSRIMVQFDVSYTASTNNTDTSFRMSLDGTPQRGTGGTSRNTTPASDSCALTWVSGALTAGPHTVLIEWLVSSSTALINVVTVPGSHHASLVLQEIAA